MKIGLVCHSTLGGSGVIATELGEELQTRGHEVHFVCAARPPRLRTAKFHLVTTPTHELFPNGEYSLALTSKLIDLAGDFDVLHVHYGIPHAVSGALACAALGTAAPALVTTLHGTDVLTIGREEPFLPVLKYSVQQSDAVTAPTRYLAQQAQATFGVNVEVIGNFVDAQQFKPSGDRSPKLIHNSNFRPLKRVDDVVRVYAAVLKKTKAELVLIGDGPTRAPVEQLARSLDVPVTFLGETVDICRHLQGASAFLFPSENESFGLAALEAMACGVPVIASRTGGLPELVVDGHNGYLRSVGDTEAMAECAVALLTQPELHRRLSLAARADAETIWSPKSQVDRYEALYRKLIS